jgi:hypothetical protein
MQGIGTTSRGSRFTCAFLLFHKEGIRMQGRIEVEKKVILPTFLDLQLKNFELDETI